MRKWEEKTINVFIMDLLCVTPFYDRYLCKALQERNPSTVLGAINFYLDIDYFNRFMVHRKSGLLDLVNKLRLRNKGFFRQSLRAIEYAINLLALFARFIINRPDIIHVQWIPLVHRVPFELWFLKLLKKRGVKLVYTVHNLLPHDTGLRYKDIYSKVYQLMDTIICHTKQTKNQLINEFEILSYKIHIIPHGPMFHDSTKITKADARDKLGYRESQPFVLFFGSIYPYKGLEFLLEAWKIVIERCPDSRLVIAGNGDKDYLDKITGMFYRLGLEHSVKALFKFIPNEELPFFYQAADILVYPYRDITQSGALLTGMAFGKPIVATSVGGFKEILQDSETGLLVEYGNISELANALINLIQQPYMRDRLGKAVLKEIELRYSWDVIAKKTIECYDSLV